MEPLAINLSLIVARGSAVKSPQGWGAHRRACKAEGKEHAKVTARLGVDCDSLELL